MIGFSVLPARLIAPVVLGAALAIAPALSAAGAPADIYIDEGAPGLLTLTASDTPLDIAAGRIKDWYVDVHNEAGTRAHAGFRIEAESGPVESAEALFIELRQCSEQWVRSGLDGTGHVQTPAACPGNDVVLLAHAEVRDVRDRVYAIGELASGESAHVLVRIARGQSGAVPANERFTLDIAFTATGADDGDHPVTGVGDVWPALLVAGALVAVGVGARIRAGLLPRRNG